MLCLEKVIGYEHGRTDTRRRKSDVLGGGGCTGTDIFEGKHSAFHVVAKQSERQKFLLLGYRIQESSSIRSTYGAKHDLPKRRTGIRGIWRAG